nr:hypothetical protein [Tanacetum cinerariifolium]
MSLFYQRLCHGCSQPCDGYYCESCMCPQCGMTLFNGICDNCIYGAGMPIICTECGGIVRGGLCLPCDLREKDLYNYYPNAYSFDNSNYFPQPQDENYLCNICRNNSHDDYDCQQQFPFVYEQEPSYNQNYDDNYYPHESLSYPCCDYYLKELAEYDQSTRTDRPIFLNDNADHPVQNKESPENSSEETVVSKTNQEPPQDSDIHQLLREECCIEFLCIHDDVDNLIESALDSKLLSINSINSQHLDKKEQEVKNVVEQPAERRSRAEKSLQNFRVIHKSSISFKNISQISSIHSIAPIESTKEPEYLLSMGYEHLSITPETESDEVTEFNAENLLPIPNNDNFDSSDDESLSDEDVPAEEFKIYSNSLFDEDKINSDKLDPHCFKVESDFVESFLNRDTFIDFSSKFDFSGELAHIKPEILKFDFDFEEEICLIENLLYDNSFPRPPEEHNAEIVDTIIESIPLPILVQDGNSQQEEINIVTKTDDMLPPSDDNDDDLSNDSLLGEADLFLFDDSIPPGIENVVDDPEGDIHFLEELLINDSILSHESFDSSFEDNPSISRPPPEPPDDELDLEPDSGKDILAVVNKDVSDDENDDYFMFVIRFFLPYFVFPEISPLLLSAESEDTIFDPGISE